MDSTFAILLTVITSLILWIIIAPFLIYSTYKFWQTALNDINEMVMKQLNTLSVLLSFIITINSTFTLPLITLIYIYYYQYNLNQHLYLTLYPFIICLISFIYLCPLIYNIRLFLIYYEWKSNVHLLSLKINNSYLFDSRQYHDNNNNINKNRKIHTKILNKIDDEIDDEIYEINNKYLPWTIKYKLIFGNNLKFIVFIIILLWFLSTLFLWIFIGRFYSIYSIFQFSISFIIFLITFILTIFVSHFNDSLGIKKELISITCLIVIGLILYIIINILTYSHSFQRIFCIFLLIEIIQIFIVFRIIYGDVIPCIDNIINKFCDNSGFNTFGGSFISDTINIDQILNDDAGFKWFATYLISELNVSHLLFLCDFIKLQNYMMQNEWIKEEYTNFNIDINLNDNDNDNNHNTVGQCINDIHYIYNRYLKQNAISKIHIVINNNHNIKLLMNEFINNNHLNNKNELQILKAIYIQFEHIAFKVYTLLSQQSINRFILSKQYKNWKSSSYKTFNQLP